MFSTYGYEEIIRNAYRVARPIVGDDRSIQTTGDLRPYYLDFLENHQPYMPVNRTDDLIIADDAVEDALLAAYGRESKLNDLKQTEIIGDAYTRRLKAEKVDIVRRGLEEFRKLDDTLCAVFDLVIHSVFVRSSNYVEGRASHGGSSSSAMGVIWMAVGPKIAVPDVVEMLLHELTHHLLFLDECNYPHFDYALIKREDTRAFSAILNMSRPIDKVVHSIMVATELVLGRGSFPALAHSSSVHPPTPKLIDDVLTACASLNHLDPAAEVLRPRSRDFVDRCLAACTSKGSAKHELAGCTRAATLS